ncbi:hypothetical protein [Agromyces sp. S2-1-8]|uniref:hypothetical protein n=1 Tax=Agromyces sp. S2-1-8 TaxID=2897180 RepID=UPI001E31FE75|nr:hypothetical protein [Agromyces sp. S2-1-8]MCD5348417.1 hypothetical protein [Agromyces sp. S2-1-8]
MTTASFQALVRAVIDDSVANTWADAVLEWEVDGLEEDPRGLGMCVCGQPNLVQLFTIRNTRNGNVLFPIGSKCVHQFEVKELDQQVNVLSDLLRLRTAINDGKFVTLTSEYFTRALLEFLYDEGAFPPDQWNGGDGEVDVDFLLKMFNKRDKDAITPPQRRKIRALLMTKVFPFVQAYQRVR